MARKFNQIAAADFQPFPKINGAVVFHHALGDDHLGLAAGADEVCGLEQLDELDMVAHDFEFYHFG